MKANVGSYDAGIRFLLGCGILFTSVNGAGWWGLLGFVPILSGACGFCPMYWIFGVDTAAWEDRYEDSLKSRNFNREHRRHHHHHHHHSGHELN